MYNYADEVILLIKGKYVSTRSEIIKSELSTILSQTKRTGIKFTKDRGSSFAKIYKIPLLHQDDIIVKLSNEAKYIDVILDSKLSRKLKWYRVLLVSRFCRQVHIHIHILYRTM